MAAALLATVTVPTVAAQTVPDQLTCLERASTNEVLWCSDGNGGGGGGSDGGENSTCTEETSSNIYYGEWAKAVACLKPTSDGCNFEAWGRVQGNHFGIEYGWSIVFEIYHDGKIDKFSWTGQFEGPDERWAPHDGTLYKKVSTDDIVYVRSHVRDKVADGTPAKSGGVEATSGSMRCR